MNAVSRKQAEKIAERLGLALSNDGRKTFYATNEDESELWEFDSHKEREEAIYRANTYWREALLEMLVG